MGLTPQGFPLVSHPRSSFEEAGSTQKHSAGQCGGGVSSSGAEGMPLGWLWESSFHSLSRAAAASEGFSSGQALGIVPKLSVNFPPALPKPFK